MAGAKKVKPKGMGPTPKYSAWDPNRPSKGQLMARDLRLHRGYAKSITGEYIRTSSRPYPKSAKTSVLGLPQNTVDAVKVGLGLWGGAAVGTLVGGGAIDKFTKNLKK